MMRNVCIIIVCTISIVSIFLIPVANVSGGWFGAAHKRSSHVNDDTKRIKTNNDLTVEKQARDESKNLTPTSPCRPVHNYWSGYAAYLAGDYITAIKEIGPLAEKGDPRSQYVLGVMFLNGLGVPSDSQKAIDWFCKAAQKKHYEALFQLGKVYDLGEGVEQDKKKAMTFYLKAAQNGVIKAQYNLGLMYQEGDGVNVDYSKSAKWFRSAAEKGLKSAQCNIGYLYDKGLGVIQDFNQAVVWYRRAAEKGHVLAQFNLGLMYLEGHGVIQDYVQVCKYFSMAAEAGHYPAQYNLGLMYAEGLGVSKDNVCAHKWLNIAASLAPDAASRDRVIKARDKLAGLLSSVQLAEAQKLARVWKPGDRVHETEEEPQETEGPDSKAAALKSYGTGFVISQQGYILTNYHVIDDCGQIRLKGSKEELKVVAKDANNDLAILKSPIKHENFAVFREGDNIRPGDGVVVIGYPYTGLLAASPQVTVGTLSALAGLGNDSRFYQFSAPVQPGSSGGPLLDESGHVVGVVVGKLNALKVAALTGDVPQNINFAISSSVVRAFLDANGFPIITEASVKKIGGAEIAEGAKGYIVLLECWR